MKKCISCNQIKNYSYFYRRKGRDGYRGNCKECQNAIAKQWHKNNPGMKTVYTNKWKEKHPEKYHKDRRMYIWKSLGINITFDRYEELRIKQKGLCAICGKEESVPSRRLAVDHNHETGKVRGLLCSMCNNRVLWVVECKKELIDKAQKYLELYV